MSATISPDPAEEREREEREEREREEREEREERGERGERGERERERERERECKSLALQYHTVAQYKQTLWHIPKAMTSSCRNL